MTTDKELINSIFKICLVIVLLLFVLFLGITNYMCKKSLHIDIVLDKDAQNMGVSYEKFNYKDTLVIVVKGGQGERSSNRE